MPRRLAARSQHRRKSLKLYTRDEEDQFIQGKLLAKVDIKLEEENKAKIDKLLDENGYFT